MLSIPPHGGNLQAFRTRQQADRLYGEVERLAASSGCIGVPQMVQAVRRALKEASAAKLPDKPTIKLLSEWAQFEVPPLELEIAGVRRRAPRRRIKNWKHCALGRVDVAWNRVAATLCWS